MDKPKIAFIDDEARILRSLKMMFRPTHDVFTTTDPNELLDYVQTNDVQVVVSDQRMPDMLGVDVLKKVSEVQPTTMRILLTGYADLNAVLDSVNEGEIYRYVTKPWQNEELEKIVNTATSIAIETKDTPVEEQMAIQNVHSDRRILVLDDEKATFEAIKDQFEPAYRVSWANSLDDAGKLINKHSFGVVIADVTLAGDDIKPVIYALKNIQPQLMMIVLSKQKDAEMIIELINKGQIYRCLPRPTNLALLQISVERAFDKHDKFVAQPKLVARHHVDEVPEEELSSLSDKINGFLGKLQFWKGFGGFKLGILGR